MKRKLRILALTLMILITIFLNADQLVMTPFMDQIMKEYNVNFSDLGKLGLVFTIFGAFISLFWGYWGDKINRKWLFVLGVLIGEIPCFLIAFAQNWTQFFILICSCRLFSFLVSLCLISLYHYLLL